MGIITDENGKVILVNGRALSSPKASDIQVVDELNSTSKTSALSANQGRILNEKINDIDKNDDSPIPNYVSVVIGGSNPQIMKYNNNIFYLFLSNTYCVSKDGGKTWGETKEFISLEKENSLDERVTKIGKSFGFLSTIL